MEFTKKDFENIRKGDSSGFNEFVREFSGKAFALTLRILNSREEAEDSLQDAFMKMYRALVSGQFQERSKLSTYFYSIVYNTAIDHYGKLKSKRFSIISIDVDGSSYEEGDDLEFGLPSEKEALDANMTDRQMKENEIREIVQSYITKIPEQYSVILTMFYINDLTHEEISEILKLPLGTVKNRIFRAKAKLREIILRKFSEEDLLQYV